jgi:hypothetical protein
MLVNINNLINLKVTASNDPVGRVNDFYFSDLDWNISYAEVKPKLLVLKNILANNMKFGQPNLDHKLLPILISKDKVAQQPTADSVKTLSDQKENHQAAFATWPLNLSNLNALDISEAQKLADIMVRDKKDLKTDSHLRSFKEIKGYYIKTPTGSFGHLKSLILETEIWKIKYLLIQKRRLVRPNKKILVSPANVVDIKWEDNSIYIDLSKNIIRESPEYEDIKSISDNFEKKLIRHYLKRNRQKSKIKQ